MVIQFFKSSFQKVKAALAKTRSLLGEKIRILFSGPLDEATLEQLEQALYEADLGVQTAQELTAKIRSIHLHNRDLKPDELLERLQQEILQIVEKTPHPQPAIGQHPHVVMIVGVNGNGKTTATAKLAKRFQDAGKTVMMAAADTFRAAAVEQLETWAHRLQLDIVKGSPKSDPAAVAFDALTAAKARGADVVIVDTAGRLHTKTPLMQELEKIRRTCQKVVPSSPHEVLLVLDATTGQNGVEQAQTFCKFVPITGLILTKIDGTAKGGVAINIQRQLGIPILFLGTGEGVEDLEPFEAGVFVKGLFG
jgi:fused signal recognition particle receptor